MKKILLSTLIMCFTLSLLLAQTNTEHKGCTPGRDEHNCDKHPAAMRNRTDKPMMEIWEQLKLSIEQQQKIRGLREDHQKHANIVQAEIRNLMIDLRNAIQADKFNHARSLQKQISDKRLQLADARLNLMESIIKELNAEQREVFRRSRPMMGRGERLFHMSGNRRGRHNQCHEMNDHQGDCGSCIH